MDKICSNTVENLLKRESERQKDILRKKNEKKLACAENEQYDYFNNIFDEKYKEIDMMLEKASSLTKNQLTEEFDKMSKELNLLKKFMTDSVIFLRGYDIRVCNGRLQELETKIKKTEESLLPKKKFGFKSKKIHKEQIPVDVVDGTTNGIKKYTFFEENFFGFKDCSDQTLVLDNHSLFKKDVSLHNLTNCTVFLPGSPSTLHMSTLSNCIIFCGPVCTSIFAENCVDSKFIIACQQLRLHSSFKCDIYIHVTSKAIIEDSKGIRVAPYNYNYTNVEMDFEKSGLDTHTNHWNALDDFNWLVADKHSPNWSVLDDADQISDWDKFLSKTSQENV